MGYRARRSQILQVFSTLQIPGLRSPERASPGAALLRAASGAGSVLLAIGVNGLFKGKEWCFRRGQVQCLQGAAEAVFPEYSRVVSPCINRILSKFWCYSLPRLTF